MECLKNKLIFIDINIINDFLGDIQPFKYKNERCVSNLVAGIGTCRDATKRDANTGKVPEGILRGGPENWLGALGYFAILDLIGTAFEKTDGENKERSSIEFAIKSFAFDLVQNEKKKVNAIYALRNAFAHDFNLLNDNKKEKYRHKFTVYAEPDPNIVTLPLKPWDGDISGKNFKDVETITFVNLWAFGDMVEEIFRRIKVGINDGATQIQMDISTLLNRYTFVLSGY
jgi:hypothetical protein